MFKNYLLILVFIGIVPGLIMADEKHPGGISAEQDSKAFKALKDKLINPQTGLPRALDPDLFKGKARQAYRIAREIPEILAQMPCFCGCEAFGHENLLDCFVDDHGAG